MRGTFSYALILLAVLLASPARAEMSDTQILHLLNRMSYGPALGDIDAVRDMGFDRYLEQQLHPAGLPRAPEMDQRLAQLKTLQEPLPQLALEYALPPNIKDLTEAQAKEIRKRQNTALEELTEAKILRATFSPAQLQEVMTDFWFNHFNVFADKGPDRLMISSYERDAIRPYALGKFGDLLFATAQSPAMLFYLDNWQNTAPDSLAARGKKIGINENYARELMELHTLGVDGGYTQADVTALAHILTGWGLSQGKEDYQRSAFFFDARRHDFADQIWLKYRIQGGDAREIEQVLYTLAHQPATAHHIAYQLAQYFVADDPPPALVNRLAETFISYDGDIAQVLRVLFHSQQFWDAANAQQKFKPPFRYVISALRASGITQLGDTRLLQGFIAQMGEPLYRCQTPNGYAATNDQWLNSDALLKRIDFAKKVAAVAGLQAGAAVYGSYGANWSATTIGAVQNANSNLKTALLLGSPEFVYY